jgi:hypothetical protein
VVSSGFVGNIFLLVQLGIPIILFFSLRKQRNKLESQILLFIYLLFLVLFALNPLNPTLYHGILGILLHIGFWLLIIVYLDNDIYFPAERLLPLILFLLLMETTIGFIQYQLPASHFINRYAYESGNSSIAKVGIAVRTTGTFSYLSGYTAFLMLAGLSLVATFKIGYLKLLRYFTVLALFVSSMLSGSRATFIISFFFIFFSFYLELKKLNIIFKIINIIFLSFFFLFIFNKSLFVQKAFDNILIRFKSGISTNEYDARTFGILEEVINFRGEYPITGLGLGATYQGANAIWGESRYVKRYPGGYEEEPERIVLEGGYLLLFFKLLLLFFLLLKSKIPKGFLLLLFLFQFIGFPIVFNIYNAFYFFVGLAILDRAYRRY